MEEELQTHLRLRADDLVRSGLKPTDAERQARVEFGGIQRYKEACREAAGGTMWETVLRDSRFALRMLRKSPILTSVAIGTLVLGIGANTAIFSLADGSWLRPLPIADPSHLISIENVKSHATADSEQGTRSSYPEFLDLRERVPAFVEAAASARRELALETVDGFQVLLAEVVSDNYFSFMGIQPELGRLPNENEIRHDSAPIIVLSHGAWKRVFGGNPAIIGQTVKIKGGMATVLAVMPAGFRGTERFIDPQVYIPQSSWVMHAPDERNVPRTLRDFDIYARLRQGATLDEAKAQLQALTTDLSNKYPQANAGREFTADWEAKAGGAGIKVIGILLLAIAGAILLIACTNIANLLLALNDSRQREFAMRMALGAARRQLLRQLVTECAVLVGLGVAGALALARWLIALVPALLPNIGFPLGLDFRIDPRVLAYTAVAGAMSVLLCGLLPALASIRSAPLDAMRAQAVPGGKLKMPARKIFVVAQLSVSMALLMATGLLMRTLLQLENMNMGFNKRQNAVLLSVAAPYSGAQRQAELNALVDRMKALPGVKDASVARTVPLSLSGGGATQIVLSPGEIPSQTAGTPIWFNSVDSAYFRVMGVPLVRGRVFSTQDTAISERVAIVNQTLAKKLFGSEDVVGRSLRIGRQQPVDAEIVGVAHDGKYNGLNETSQPYLYLPLAQNGLSDVTLIVTTAGNPAALLSVARKILKQASPNTIIFNAETLTDHMRLATYPNRMATWLIASMGALALLLTTIGLYGVTAYTVSRRTHEIGVRMSLGALRRTVFALVLKDGLKLVLAGIVVGIGLAILLGRAISGEFYGVKPADAITFAGVGVLVLATSILALIGPARRAISVDPVNALREQ
jgi:predicted permease